MELPSDKNNEPQVRKIMDHAQLHQITEKLFCRLPIHLVENNKKHPVKVLQYQHPHLEVLHRLGASTTRALLLEKEDHSMMLECSVAGRGENGTEFLKPVRIFLTKRGIRHESRVALGDTGIVTHCMPQSEFHKTNAATNAARDALIAHFKAALQELIPDTLAKINLQRHNRPSVRVKKLQEFNLPIFAPVMATEPFGEDLKLPAMPYSEYVQIMRTDDLPGDFIGEICEPIRYRGALIIGYVQLLSTRAPLNISQYHSVRQLTRRLENDLETRNSFPKNPITGKIVDISFSGIGFLYSTQRNIMSGVSKGDKIVFDVRFTSENATTLTGRVMNISAQENGMRFGVEMENISETARAAIDAMVNKETKNT